MVNSGDTYDLARVGAEIAYTVGQEGFGLQNIQLNEPSEGGARRPSCERRKRHHPGQDVGRSKLLVADELGCYVEF